MVPEQIEREIVIQGPTGAGVGGAHRTGHVDRWFTAGADLDLRPGGSHPLPLEGARRVPRRGRGRRAAAPLAWRWALAAARPPPTATRRWWR